MNRILLASFVALSSFSLGANYDSMRKDLPEQLYIGQKGLMPHEEYIALVQPYLEQAENEFEVVKYFKQHPDSPLVDEYFKLLKLHNIRCFIRLKNGYPMELWTIGYFEGDFMKCIKKISEEGLLNLNILEEYLQTTALLVRANKAYIQKLKEIENKMVRPI